MYDGYWKPFTIGDYSLLLLQANGKPRLIENRCGHFGIPLAGGTLEGDTIVCPEHHISFSLETGNIANRPYENADPIRIFKITAKDEYLGVELEP